MTTEITMNAPNKLFTEAYNALVKGGLLIDFNERWKNGTGYFDNAVKGLQAPNLTNGEMVVSTDDQNRRMILIGTAFGNIVVFDRYSGAARQVFVTNHPHTTIVNSMVPNGSINEHTMSVLLGGWGNLNVNIGFRINDIIEEANELETV